MMDNWFYLDRKTFKTVLYDELGTNLTDKLVSMDFDTPISFLIGQTSDEVLINIQQTFTRKCCYKTQCHNQCIICPLSPPNYAKLSWFIQRLLIMSPITKPFINKQNSTCQSSNQNSTDNNCSSCPVLFLIIILLLFIIFFLIPLLIAHN